MDDTNLGFSNLFQIYPMHRMQISWKYGKNIFYETQYIG